MIFNLLICVKKQCIYILEKKIQKNLSKLLMWLTEKECLKQGVQVTEADGVSW